MNWDTFVALPGAAEINFEMLCRAIVRWHYGRFGDFYALANQPGVEFHLKLNASCTLGDPGRWYGWQCRWYELQRGRAIGTTRRRKIVEAIEKSEAEVPGLTDWALWTRHPLTAGDQKWFYDLNTSLQLHLWTSAEVEEHLCGPAEILRSTYFGELVLTPDLLAELHAASVAPIRRRWQPEVHQTVNAERALRRYLGALEAWSILSELAQQLLRTATIFDSDAATLPSQFSDTADDFVATARALAETLTQIHAALGRGDFDVLHEQLGNLSSRNSEWKVFVRRLRSGRHVAVLSATNILADLHRGHRVLSELHQQLTRRLVAVVADAGCGKTELSAQLTAPTDDRAAGLLVHGRDLQAGRNLDDLARSIAIRSTPAPSFESLVAALNAAGERSGRRLPLVIDGLNEAEDPRDWRAPLASLTVALDRYPYVLLICTLRSAFADEALPDDVQTLSIPHFENDTVDAIGRYFRHYRIDPGDAELPYGLLQHPLTLRLFCEVTNPRRERTVGVEAMPASLTGLFERYLEQVAERIAQLAPRTHRYHASDVHAALEAVGAALWHTKARSLDMSELRRNINDQDRPWNESLVRALEHDGVLFREPGKRPGQGRLAATYDALAGYLIADALLADHGGLGFEAWVTDPQRIGALSGNLDERHPLATDTFNALAGLVPRRMHRRQLWPMLPHVSG